MAIKINGKIVSEKQVTKPIVKKKEKQEKQKHIFYIDDDYKLYYGHITLDEGKKWVTIMAYRNTDSNKQYHLMKVDRKNIGIKK